MLDKRHSCGGVLWEKKKKIKVKEREHFKKWRAGKYLKETPLPVFVA
jgi:hypothetical protein